MIQKYVYYIAASTFIDQRRNISDQWNGSGWTVGFWRQTVFWIKN